MESEKLRWLVDRAEIEDVLHAYTRGFDRQDEDCLKACFWPEATYRLATIDGPASDVIGRGLAMARKLQGSAHHMTNILITLNGDAAISDASWFAHHAPRDGDDVFMHGRYVDRFEKRDGAWRILRRIAMLDYRTSVPRAAAATFPPGHQASGRMPDDPVYQLLREIGRSD